MLTALVTAVVGAGATLAIGMNWVTKSGLPLSALDAFLCVIASNVGGFLALMFTQRTRRWIHGGMLTWFLFLMIYWGCQLAFAPALREPAAFFILLVPCALSCGFGIIAFGPIQDRLVASERRRNAS